MEGSMDIDQQVQALDHPTLKPLVRRVLDQEDAELLGWEQRAIPSLLGSAALSLVYRLNGTARVGDETRPWSLILKVLKRPAQPSPGWDRPSVRSASWPDTAIDRSPARFIELPPQDAPAGGRGQTPGIIMV